MMTIKIKMANIIFNFLADSFCAKETPAGAANNNPPTMGRKIVGSIYPN